LKENVIMGRLIPAGTGISRYRSLRVIADEPAKLDSVESLESGSTE